MKNETIGDIVRELRSRREFFGAEMSALADRIEAAANHTCEYAIPNFGCASGNRYLEENAGLRAALKPVLEFDLRRTYAGGAVKAFDAIREAQLIYNEGASKSEYGI